jgi:RNA polymerase-binding transcription factor DksA
MGTRRHTGAKPKPRRKAGTVEVLGARSRVVRVAGKWQHHYERLTELLGHLVRHQADLAQDAREEQPSFSLHIADAGTDSFDRDFALGLLSSEQDAIYEIEQALKRIRDGSYGRCELTGKPIEPARLEAIPWTRFTAAAKKQLEREGVVQRARLGPRRSVTESKPTDASVEED